MRQSNENTKGTGEVHVNDGLPRGNGHGVLPVRRCWIGNESKHGCGTSGRD